MDIIAWLRLFLHHFVLVQAKALEEKRIGFIEETEERSFSGFKSD